MFASKHFVYVTHHFQWILTVCVKWKIKEKEEKEEDEEEKEEEEEEEEVCEEGVEEQKKHVILKNEYWEERKWKYKSVFIKR